MIETIKKRSSVRSFTNQVLEPETLTRISDFLSANSVGPFGNKVRFKIISASIGDPNELQGLGTYGMIRGANAYLTGAVTRGSRDMEDYGYCMEKNILMLTELGLGTCWLGGTFSRSAFGQKMALRDNEVIPAVTPIGYPLPKRSARETLIRFVVGARNRKPFSELFFLADATTPLSFNDRDPWSIALECVRLGPSASNKQPWRIIRAKGAPLFHFFLKEDRLYNNAIKHIKIQNIDMGIAMCHFEAAAKELGLQGSWQNAVPEGVKNELTYIVSWRG